MHDDRPCDTALLERDGLFDIAFIFDDVESGEGFAAHGVGLRRHLNHCGLHMGTHRHRATASPRSPPVTWPPAARASASARTASH